MNSQEAAILAFIETHGTCILTGIKNSFPHFTEDEIDNALEDLSTSGWIKRKESFVRDGMCIPEINWRRTKKKMYSQ